MIGSANDETLVRKALTGQARAWDRLLNRYEKPIYNFALRTVGNRDDALDLVQETFLSVYRNLNSFNGKASFKTWLYTIASRRAVDLFRRRKPSESLDDTDSGSSADTLVDGGFEHDPQPMAELLKHETNRHLLSLLRQLNEDERLVVEMKCFGEMTFDEIESALQVSANTLKSRFYGALRKMKAMPEVAHVL